MLTSPNEIVPLQMARGALADSLLGRVGVLRAVLCAIHNILDSLRAVGRPAPRASGGRLPRHLERHAQGVREPARPGDEGPDLGPAPLAPAGPRGRAACSP